MVSFLIYSDEMSDQHLDEHEDAYNPIPMTQIQEDKENENRGLC